MTTRRRLRQVEAKLNQSRQLASEAIEEIEAIASEAKQLGVALGIEATSVAPGLHDKRVQAGRAGGKRSGERRRQRTKPEAIASSNGIGSHPLRGVAADLSPDEPKPNQPGEAKRGQMPTPDPKQIAETFADGKQRLKSARAQIPR
jgi:hypothetical protein